MYYKTNKGERTARILHKKPTFTFLGVAADDTIPLEVKLFGRSVTRCSPNVIAPYLKKRESNLKYIELQNLIL